MSILKRFFISMLGSIAALWISALLIFGLIFLFVIKITAGDVTVDVNVDDNSVLVFDLTGVVDEREVQTDFFDEMYGDAEHSLPLNGLLNAIKAAKDDKRVEGIYIKANGISAGTATLESLHEALEDFKTSGKWIVAYGDMYGQADYYLASAADELYVNPMGEVDIHGLSATTMFFKGLLDKIGVNMQIVKVGQYKSAVEPFMLTEMSEASRKQQQEYLNDIWDVIGGGIAKSRKVSFEKVNEWADSLTMCRGTDYLVAEKIVDKTYYQREIETLLKEKCGIDADDDLKSVSIEDYMHVAEVPHSDSEDDKIAVLYAVGDITESGKGGIASDRLVPLIINLSEDEDLKGMVLRVNSGGGSAFASEQIWEALEHFKASGKKLYVSMGDYAASGGYYISCGADRIYAQPTTLTGSIGIFGMIPCGQKLLNDHLGITTGNVSTNANGDFLTFDKPMTPEQYAMMQNYIERGYETFVSRCAQGRNMSTADIKEIAEGRVWSGSQALKIKLVDQLGTLDMAVTDLAADLNLSDYQVIEYPRLNFTFWELLFDEVELNNAALKSSIGAENMELYRQAKRILDLEPMQARMENVKIR